VPWTVVLAHAEGEERCAEEVAARLLEAGYDAWHRGTVLVGESFSEEAQKALAKGGPVVLCATVGAMGTGFAHHLVAASRPLDKNRVFILKMEEKAYVEQIAGDRLVADYWKDPSAAIRQLKEALLKRFPDVHSTPRLLISKDRLRQHREFLERLFLERMQAHERLTDEQAAGWYQELVIRQRELDSFRRGQAAGANNEIKEAPVADFLVRPGARLLVLGDGGTGKSTSLCKLAAEAARRCEHDSQVPVPIYVELAQFDAHQGGGFDRLLQMASNAAQFGLDREGLAALWREGLRPVLFLFDGLNEVKPELQPHCISALQELASRGPHRYVVTSRPGGGAERLAPPAGGFTVCEVLRFGPDQVRGYLEDRGARGFYDRLGGRLKDLVRTPFLLMALAQSCAGMRDTELPANLGQLYRTFIDDFIFARREPSKPSPPTRYDYEAVKKPLLAFFSSRMTNAATVYLDWDAALEQETVSRLGTIQEAHHRTKRVMPEDWRVDDFLAELERNGVVHRVAKRLAFSHQSIQEYFAAVADLALGGDELVAKAPRLIWRHVVPSRDYSPETSAHPRWMTTIMLAGILPNATDLVRSLHSFHPVLAAECLRAATLVDPELRAELYRSWLAFLQSPQMPRRWVGCVCVGAARISTQEVIDRLVDLAADTKEAPDTNLATEQGGRIVAAAAANALAEIGSEAALSALLQRALQVVEDDDWTRHEQVALPRANPLLIRLLMTEWRAAAPASARQHHVQTILAGLGRRQVRRELNAMLLGAQEKADIQLQRTLEQALREFPSWHGAGIPTPDDATDYWYEARARRQREVELQKALLAAAPLAQLLGMLTSARWQDREAAAATIATRSPVEAVEKLIDVYVREPIADVAAALGEAIRHQNADSSGLQALKSRLAQTDPALLFALDADLRTSLAQGEIPELLRQTFQAQGIELHDHARLFSANGAWQIANWHEADPTAPRYEIRNDNCQLNVYVANSRARIAVALGLLDTAEGIPVFERLLQDEDPAVKWVAIRELSARAPVRAALVPQFITALDDTSPAVRAAAAEALGKAAEASAAAPLADLLRRQAGHSAAESVINALRQIRSDVAVDGLTEALFMLRTSRSFPLLRIGGRELDLDYGDEGWGSHRTPGWAVEIHDALEYQEAGKRVLNLMTTALVSGDEGRRLVAAREIQRWMKSAAVQGRNLPEEEALWPLLIDIALNDPALEVRKAAAIGLRWSRTTNLVPIIASKLKRDCIKSSVSASVVLGWLGDEAAIDVLRGSCDGDPILRVFAGLALAQIGIEGELPEGAAEIIAAAALAELDETTHRLVCEALNEIPGSLDAFYRPVLAAIEVGEYKTALQLLQQRSPVRTQDGYHCWLRGIILLGLERLEEALIDLRQAGDWSPYWSRPQVDAAKVLDRLHRPQEALEAAKAAALVESTNAECQELLGWLAYRAGDYPLAVQSSARSLDIDPARAAARFNLALALLASDDTEGAAKNYREALAAVGKEPQKYAPTTVCEARSDLDDLARSRPDLQEAVQTALALFVARS
jgi:HEAT repeat protein